MPTSHFRPVLLFEYGIKCLDCQEVNRNGLLQKKKMGYEFANASHEVVVTGKLALVVGHQFFEFPPSWKLKEHVLALLLQESPVSVGI
jgi:hypothetical protein